MERIPGELRPSYDSFFPSSEILEESLVSSANYQEIVKYIEENGGSVQEDLLKWPAHRGGDLTDLGILRHMLAGNIKIEPFDIKQLESTGYSLRVSGIFFRRKTYQEMNGHNVIASYKDNKPIYDAYSQKYLDIVWGEPLQTTSGADIIRDYETALHGAVAFDRRDLSNNPLYTILPEEQLIFVQPNEMILGCTEEAIGGCNIVTTKISGKSSVGRHGFEVCSDAFLGEPGFTFPWVLEIVNKHPDTINYLKKGTLVATMTFSELTELPLRQYTGRYLNQGSNDPRSLLPKPLKK